MAVFFEKDRKDSHVLTPAFRVWNGYFGFTGIVGTATPIGYMGMRGAMGVTGIQGVPPDEVEEA